MKETIRKEDPAAEYETQERCSILELWNRKIDSEVSVARATVNPGITTRLHRLNGVVERYVILSGKGEVTVGELKRQAVEPNDVVLIPDGVAQQITNTGREALVFLCICSPRFIPECYEDLD